MRFHSVPTITALALALAASLPAQAQQAPQAQLYIDVATHSMPGTPGMGAIGRLAGAMGGATASNNYGMALHPGMPGKYLDVALLNASQPGASARQAVPRGLGVGKEIQLLPPEPRASDHDTGPAGEHDGYGMQGDGSYRIRHYWGCGEQAGVGQPTEFTMTIRDGKMVTGGRMAQPRQVPANNIKPGPQYALWPNPSARKAVGSKASLVGTHQLTGDGLPGAMDFELDQNHDFMPELVISGHQDDGQGMELQWNEVTGARAYFAHAIVMDGESMVMWSSSEDGYAGPELVAYLPGSLLTQWTGKRTLMDAGTRSCRIPAEVFADGAQPMIQVIAYGNESTITQPRPADADRDWQPAWSVRVRNKSTAMLMPGMAAVGQDAAREAARPAVKDAAKNVLRGLFGH